MPPKTNAGLPKSTAVKRIMTEFKEQTRTPSPYFIAGPLDNNIYEWHFTLRGPTDSEFEGGKYHGKILLPTDYPFSPPDIIFMTPNGRFDIGQKICLSITRYHTETWQPSLSIRKMLESIGAFMITPPEGAVGGIDTSPEIRKHLAQRSKQWVCPTCGISNDDLLPNEKDEDIPVSPRKAAPPPSPSPSPSASLSQTPKQQQIPSTPHTHPTPSTENGLSPRSHGTFTPASPPIPASGSAGSTGTRAGTASGGLTPLTPLPKASSATPSPCHLTLPPPTVPPSSDMLSPMQALPLSPIPSTESLIDAQSPQPSQEQEPSIATAHGSDPSLLTSSPLKPSRSLLKHDSSPTGSYEAPAAEPPITTGALFLPHTTTPTPSHLCQPGTDPSIVSEPPLPTAEPPIATPQGIDTPQPNQTNTSTDGTTEMSLPDLDLPYPSQSTLDGRGGHNDSDNDSNSDGQDHDKHIGHDTAETHLTSTPPALQPHTHTHPQQLHLIDPIDLGNNDIAEKLDVAHVTAHLSTGTLSLSLDDPDGSGHAEGGVTNHDEDKLRDEHNTEDKDEDEDESGSHIDSFDEEVMLNKQYFFSCPQPPLNQIRIPSKNTGWFSPTYNTSLPNVVIDKKFITKPISMTARIITPQNAALTIDELTQLTIKEYMDDPQYGDDIKDQLYPLIDQSYHDMWKRGGGIPGSRSPSDSKGSTDTQLHHHSSHMRSEENSEGLSVDDTDDDEDDDTYSDTDDGTDDNSDDASLTTPTLNGINEYVYRNNLVCTTSIRQSFLAGLENAMLTMFQNQRGPFDRVKTQRIDTAREVRSQPDNMLNPQRYDDLSRESIQHLHTLVTNAYPHIDDRVSPLDVTEDNVEEFLQHNPGANKRNQRLRFAFTAIASMILVALSVFIPFVFAFNAGRSLYHLFSDDE